jgi:hypothetical protein
MAVAPEFTAKSSVMSFTGMLEKKVGGGCCGSSWKSFYYSLPVGSSSMMEYKVKPHPDKMKDANLVTDHYLVCPSGKDSTSVLWKREEGQLILNSRNHGVWTLRSVGGPPDSNVQPAPAEASEEAEESAAVSPPSTKAKHVADDSELCQLFRTVLDHGATDAGKEPVKVIKILSSGFVCWQVAAVLAAATVAAARAAAPCFSF